MTRRKPWSVAAMTQCPADQARQHETKHRAGPVHGQVFRITTRPLVGMLSLGVGTRDKFALHEAPRPRGKVAKPPRTEPK